MVSYDYDCELIDPLVAILKHRNKENLTDEHRSEIQTFDVKGVFDVRLKTSTLTQTTLNFVLIYFQVNYQQIHI